MPDAPRTPTPRELRHMAARFYAAAAALHPDSAKRAGLEWQGALLRTLADGLERVTPVELAALPFAAEALRAAGARLRAAGISDGIQQGQADSVERLAAALRALLTTEEPPDGAGRVVGAIERQLTEEA